MMANREKVLSSLARARGVTLSAARSRRAARFPNR
jgi:hypothetical protein